MSAEFDPSYRLDCDEQLRFEMLLSELSARFVAVPAERVDAEIGEAQRRICGIVGVDQSSLWQSEGGSPGTFVLTHIHRPEGGPPIPDRMEGSEFFPWAVQRLLAAQVIAIRSMADIPEEAARDLETWRRFGTKSTLLVPLAAGGSTPFGIVSFATLRAEREWPEPLVKRLKLVAQVFANALVRKRFEQTLLESEARLTFALEAADMGPWMLDPPGARFWVGPRVMELFGLPPGDSLGVTRFIDLVHADDRQSVREALERIVDSRETMIAEYRIVRPDGQIRWMQSRGRMAPGAKDGRIWVTGVTTDITARKQREYELRSSEARIGAAIEVAGLGFYETGQDARVSFLDERIRALLGVPPDEELRGREYWQAHVHPEDQPRMLQACGEVRGGGLDHVSVEYRYVHPSRGTLWLQHLARVLERNPEGRAVRSVGVIADITERKQAQEAIEESERRYRTLFENAPLGIILIGADGLVRAANSAQARLYGYDSPEQLVGYSAPLFVAERDRERSARNMKDQLQGREVAPRRYRCVRRDGSEFTAEVTSGILRGPQDEVQGYLCITRDISALVEAWAAVQASEDRLRQAAEAAGFGVYQYDFDGGHAFYSSEFLALYGLPAGATLELDSDRAPRNLHPDDKALFLACMERSSDPHGSGIFEAEYRIVRNDGQARWLRARGRTVFAGEGPARRPARANGIILDITEHKQAEEILHQAMEEVLRLRDQLQNENVYLREQMLSASGHGVIVGKSEPIRKMLALARKVAPTDSTVLITGETGTGKELLAQAIHDLSARKAKTMVKVNCAALPAPLIESELFGREKGAYTGAMTQQAGRFELANGSTILLDEIGDLPLDLQGKLLRVLQDGQFERLGGHRTLKTDVRLIAATNRDLAAMVAAGKFRDDLFHRLNVFLIEAPPLRARVEDIPLLVWKFVQEFNSKMGRSVGSISKPVMERLKEYSWPGNVRELRNVIERAMIVSDGGSLRIEIPELARPQAAQPSTLEDVERKHILDMLELTHWRISGKRGAAEILGLVPTTLHSRMKKLGIVRPGSRSSDGNA